MAARRRRRQSSGFFSNIGLALVLTTFIFTFSVVLVLNAKWLYYIDITMLNIDKQSGMTVETIKENYDALILYNQFWYWKELSFPTLPMSEQGRIHFQEVKQIFVVIQVLCMASFAASVVWIIKKAGRGQYGYLKITGLLALGTPLVLGVAAIWNWERFFVTFHQIFFKNDYWLFDSRTDPVILMLPDSYFFHCAVFMLLVILLAGSLCLFLARRHRDRAVSRSRR